MFGTGDERKKWRAVMSSECVEEWTRSGAAGLRGSLEHASISFAISSDETSNSYQYRMEASSPCSSVPAAMVSPSADTSQESSPDAFPAVDAVTI